MVKNKKSNNKFVKLALKLIDKNKEYNLSEKSAVVVYYILLSVGPFLVLGLTLMTNFLSSHVDKVVEVATNLYADAAIIINPIVDYLHSSNSQTFAIVGLVTALFSSSKAAKNIMKSFNDIFRLKKEGGLKSFILNNIYSMILTLALMISLITFFVLFVTGDPIASIINFVTGFNLSEFALWNFLKNFIPIAYLFIFATSLFMVLSKFGNGATFSIKEAAIGGGFVTIGWILGSLLFTFYINNFNNNNAVYGVLGSIMIIMIWFYILMYTLLLGAALIDAYMEVEEERRIYDLQRPFKVKGIQ